MLLGNYKAKVLGNFFLLILSSCSLGDCNYVIELDYIKSNCAFKQGFYFQEIMVTSFTEEGLPDSIEVLQNFSLGLSDPNQRALKKILFFEENNGYTWFDVKQYKSFKVLPMRMESERWYRIRGLVFLGNPDRAAYLHVNDNGKLDVYGYSESKNW